VQHRGEIVCAADPKSSRGFQSVSGKRMSENSIASNADEITRNQLPRDEDRHRSAMERLEKRVDEAERDARSITSLKNV
jgi:hypothetical protein